MRILFARLLVVVTAVLIVTLATGFALFRNRSSEAPTSGSDQPPRAVTAPAADAEPPKPRDAIDQDSPPALVARGRTVFNAQRCQICHSIEGDGNPRSPLDGVGERLTEQDIRTWIVAPQQMRPGVSKRGYVLPKEDLDALVSYLLSVQVEQRAPVTPR